MPTYLITGSSRGIGLELTRQVLESSSSSSSEDTTVFAASRSSTSNPAFQNLLQAHPARLIHVPLDVTSRESIEKATALVAAALEAKGHGKGLDILINNAGVLSAGRVQDMTDNDLESTLHTNVRGVQSVTRAFLPLMRTGKHKTILNISSTLGSISLQPSNYTTLTPSYKISKAALNMLTVLYAHELQDEGFTVFCVSPGWLKTDLGSQNADLPVETGVASVLKILADKSKEDNGRFYNIEVPGWEKYRGEEVPW